MIISINRCLFSSIQICCCLPNYLYIFLDKSNNNNNDNSDKLI